MEQINESLEQVKEYVQYELHTLEQDGIYSETATERLYRELYQRGANLYKLALDIVTELYNEYNSLLHRGEAAI
jgi:hypothetical protein